MRTDIAVAFQVCLTHCTFTEEEYHGGSNDTSDEGLEIICRYRLDSKHVEDSCVLWLRECPRQEQTRVHGMKAAAKVLCNISKVIFKPYLKLIE